MSRGQSQPNHSARRGPGRCKNKGNTEKVEIIDVDKGKTHVVIIDAPESSHQGSGSYWAKGRNGFYSDVISIEDEDGDVDYTPSNACDGVTSNMFRPGSSNSLLSEESDSDECLMFVRKGELPSNLTEKMRMHPNGYPRNRYGLDPVTESSSSESDESEFCDSSGSDDSDCEIIEDSSGNIRKEWERAAFRRKNLQKGRFGSEDRSSTTGSSVDPGLQSHETAENMVDAERCVEEPDKRYSPAEYSPGSSSSETNRTSDLTNANGLVGDSLLGHKVNISTSSSDPSISVSHEVPGFHYKEETFSEKYSHRADSCDEDPCNYKDACFQDPGIQDCMHVRDDGIRFPDIDEQVPAENSSCAADVGVETHFQDREGPCPGKRSQDWVENQFYSKSVGSEDEDQVSREQSSSQSQSPVDSVVNHNIATEVKEKSFVDQTPLCNEQLMEEAQLNIQSDCVYCGKEATLEEPVSDPSSGNGSTESCSLCTGHEDISTGQNRIIGDIAKLKESTGNEDIIQVQNGLIGEREKYKESDEYRRAQEEEWASRQRELQIQAEEVQRLRKRKKAETMRLLDMEKRQKQRLEEIRESQKKDEEIINLKERLRTEVRRELDKMEGRYRDMASLLRGLGIHVGGGPYPLSHEVNAAYKQALYRFHPDRASRTDVRQQVKAEETFKLISRLKEKLLPVA